MAQEHSFSVFVEPASADEICASIFDRFTENGELVAIPVVGADGSVMGILRRTDFLVKLADRYGRPLFEKRDVTLLMDAKPLRVETATSVEELNQLLSVDETGALRDGFIVEHEGLYVGIGTANTILQANMRRAEERMVQLERAQIEAEAANRAKTNFLANMSHELRTPLNAIIGFSEIIINNISGSGMDQKHSGYVTDIRDSGQHLLNVINSILDMSKLEANAFALREDYESPAQISQQAMRIVEGQASRDNIRLLMDTGSVDCDLYADIQVMRQILLNLLSNAVKFSPSGSVVKVQLSINDSGALEIAVIDQGEGMDADALVQVMKPFVQADGKRARRHQGTGLGLPLVKAFTAAHDGEFILESEVGVGTCAKVILPASRVTTNAEADRDMI